MLESIQRIEGATEFDVALLEDQTLGSSEPGEKLDDVIRAATVYGEHGA
jgi:hypothetical protein